MGRAEGVDFGRDVVPAVLAARGRVLSFRHDLTGGAGSGLWFDVGTPEGLIDATLALYPTGAVHPTARLAPSAEVRRGVLRAGVHVGAGARVEASFVLEGAVIGARARVVRSVVGPGTFVAEGADVGPGLVHA